MAVGPDTRPEVAPVAGVRLGVTAAGIRAADRNDLVLVEFAPASRTAAVFTTNRLRAAPVRVAEEHLAAAAPRLLMIGLGFFLLFGLATRFVAAVGLVDARDRSRGGSRHPAASRTPTAAGGSRGAD